MTILEEAEKLLSTMTRAEKARLLQLLARDLGSEFSGIEISMDICGGEARIANTRIPVWVLEKARQLGSNDADILKSYPGLRADDLTNAWEYVRSHRDEVERNIKDNEEA